MSTELLEQCATARMAGLDFPTIWAIILRVHPLVGGASEHVTDGERTWLEVPLINGDRLVFSEDTGFSLRAVHSGHVFVPRRSPP